MKRLKAGKGLSILFVLMLAFLLVAAGLPMSSEASPAWYHGVWGSSGDEAVKAKVVEDYGKLPVLFIENQGQLDAKVEYYVKASGQTIYLTDSGMVFDLIRYEGTEETDLTQRKAERLVFNLNFVGADPSPVVEGRKQDEAVINYFIGNDPEKWHTNIPTYREVVYETIYPNIDLRLYGKQGSLNYDFIVKPGGNVDNIRLAYTGVDRLRLDKGELMVNTAFGDMRQTKPYIYQQIGNEELEIKGGFRLIDGNGYGFEVASYDLNYPLIIDPSLSYSTYLGGSSSDAGLGIAVDTQGGAYVTGETYSTDFPTQNPYQGAKGGYYDAFVTKLSASGDSLIYSTYLGGSDYDYGYGIAVDTQGGAYVTGKTSSTDFPTQNAYQASYAGDLADAFVTKLSASGSSLIYSTYLGGSATDSGNGIAVDGQGLAYVTGQTNSTDFPTQNAYQGANAGDRDAFVTKLSASGNALAYSTYLGGSNYDYGYGIAVDTQGGAYVTGKTSSTDFPTQNAYQASYAGDLTDAFVTKLSASGSSLIYSTYLGGSATDSGNGIAVDGQGLAYVTGETSSTDFPTQNPYQGSKGGYYDAFVTKLSASGDSLIYSTYLGGSSSDAGLGIAVDTQGGAYVTGETYSTDFPTQNAYQGANAGLTDVFFTKLSASGNSLVYSTYLGGSTYDHGRGIAVDAQGGAYVTGYTYSTNFPTQNAYQGANAGDWDAFVTKLGDPDITVAPPAIDFGSVVVGSSSPPKTVTVTNDGYANLDIGTITLGGANSDQFSIQNDNCSGQTLASGASATLQVVFTPTSTGAKSATLSIPSNDPDEDPVEVILSGSGTPPSIAVGGEFYPINKVSVLAPWLGLILILAIGGGIFALRSRPAQ